MNTVLFFGLSLLRSLYKAIAVKGKESGESACLMNTKFKILFSDAY